MKTKPISLLLIAKVCIIGLILCSNNSFAQKSVMELTFTSVNSSSHVRLDSIKVINRNQDCDTVLVYPDTTLMINFVSVKEMYGGGNDFRVFQNYPNPVEEQTTVSLFVPGKDIVEIAITDNLGRVMIRSDRVLDRGTHFFRFVPGNGSLYYFTAKWQGQSSSIKVLQKTAKSNRNCSLTYTGSVTVSPRLKTTAAIRDFSFNPGDTLLYIGYWGAMQSGMMDSPDDSQTYIFQFATNIPCPDAPTVTYEGQVYNTIQIFSQCWMKENLNVGEMIDETMDQSNNGTIEKYCYNNQPDSCTKYGAFYQWNEMMQYTMQQGTQGICPPGWHLPTDDEWKILQGAADSHYGIGDPEWDKWGGCGYDASKNLKSTSGWKANGNGLDLLGFTVLPAGDISNLSHGISEEGYFWSSTQTYNDDAWNRVFIYNLNRIWRDKYYDFYGYSVRCVKD